MVKVRGGVWSAGVDARGWVAALFSHEPTPVRLVLQLEAHIRRPRQRFNPVAAITMTA